MFSLYSVPAVYSLSICCRVCTLYLLYSLSICCGVKPVSSCTRARSSGCSWREERELPMSVLEELLITTEFWKKERLRLKPKLTSKIEAWKLVRELKIEFWNKLAIYERSPYHPLHCVVCNVCVCVTFGSQIKNCWANPSKYYSSYQEECFCDSKVQVIYFLFFEGTVSRD